MAKQQQRSTTPSSMPPTPPASPIVSVGTAPSASIVGSSSAHWLSLANKLWKQARTTLKGQFIVQALFAVLLTIGLATYVSQMLSRAYTDLDTIQHGSIPSVDAAQAMAQYIDDLDAKSADYLATGGLTNQIPCSILGTDQAPVTLTVHECDAHTIDAEISLANQQLFNAAHNVTYPGERTAIERITAGFQEYIANVSLMRSEYQQAASKTNPHDTHLKLAYQAYKAANAVLQQRISLPLLTNARGALIFNEPFVPSCQIGGRTLQPSEWANGSIEDNIDCLSFLNKSHLDQAYQDTLKFLFPTLLLVGAFCLLVCLLLVFAFGRMAVITHRIFNPGLALAVVAAGVLSITCLGLFTGMYGQPDQQDASKHGAFQQLVKDDYDSIYSTALLKRAGTNANADESRWLIALEFGDQAAVDHWQADWQQNTQRIRDLMLRAKGNQTWVEELQPLSDMQTSWDQYAAIDPRIRSLAKDATKPTPLLDAEKLSTGDSNTAFGKFLDAVDRLSKANRDHGDATSASTQQALMFSIPLTALLFPLIGLIAAWGISRRFKDF